MATDPGTEHSTLPGLAGALVGACAAVAIALASELTSVLGTALLAGVGSLLGWGISALFTSRRKTLPLTVVALAAVVALVIPAWFPRAEGTEIEASLPGPTSPSDGGAATIDDGEDPSSEGDTPSTTPLLVPDRTMSFEAVPPESAPDDMSGLIGLAKSRFGDPQRLTVKHMTYDSDPNDHYPSIIYTFTGTTAIALAETEWEWFKAGNSGDAVTDPITVGDVHCALHPQGDGYSNSECWRWDDDFAVAVTGLGFPTGSEGSVVAAVEDLFVAIRNAN
ncbi:hypothetical protein C5D04_10475 [Rathayibacter sp. AY1D2]|jgi:hypothetical protein|uniref:hypothetical protein n=1 Tax=unclassified Rathayibacter TaxID=2609250 RepID=UPI000CE878F5|nr:MULTISPECIES: hypothetical protein [unclassified Rathayibacter]PPF32468.1 hypothetical protein C5B93_15555 [Rathayibacter sp. AY1A2]PPI13227.1 hypothetical protein C5D04_10475 [Rathayibacter sp. AY1D2]